MLILICLIGQIPLWSNEQHSTTISKQKMDKYNILYIFSFAWMVEYSRCLPSFHGFKYIPNTYFTHSNIHSFIRSQKVKKREETFFPRMISKCLVCLFHHIERNEKKKKIINLQYTLIFILVLFHFESILSNVDNRYFRFILQFSMYR